MEKCQYFRQKLESWESEEVNPSLSIFGRKYYVNEWCVHESSIKTSDETGQLDCHGDASMCPLSLSRPQ